MQVPPQGGHVGDTVYGSFCVLYTLHVNLRTILIFLNYRQIVIEL